MGRKFEMWRMAVLIEWNWLRIMRLRKKANRLIDENWRQHYDKLMAYDSKITLYWGRADKAQKRYEQLAGLIFEYIPLDRLPGLAKPEA